jgi:hypothetical protein
MQLIDEELHQRYFRGDADGPSLKQKVFGQFNGFFDKNTRKAGRRMSFLVDARKSVDVSELEAKNIKLKGDSKSKFHIYSQVLDKSKTLLGSFINEWGFLALLGIGMSGMNKFYIYYYNYSCFFNFICDDKKCLICTSLSIIFNN